MTQARKRYLAKIMLGTSVIVFMGASVGMSLEMEPFYTWFYLFAWWPFIVMLESAMFLVRGYSRLYDAPGEFAELIPLSVTVWLVFEAFNFRLENWQYLNLPENLLLRWGGYFLSYATVLPALFVTKRLFEFMGLWEEGGVKVLKRPGRLHALLVALGAACLILPLVWPRYFFPLVWGGFIFLLEPLLSKRGGRSLLTMWAQGSLRQFKQLLLAGLVCGGLWEMWNFWAGAKWVYTVPFVGFLKVFEMPVLGFLGFPPFAVTCFVLYNLYLLMKARINRRGRTTKRLAWTVAVVLATLFNLTVFMGIDRFTVVGL